MSTIPKSKNAPKPAPTQVAKADEVQHRIIPPGEPVPPASILSAAIDTSVAPPPLSGQPDMETHDINRRMLEALAPIDESTWLVVVSPHESLIKLLADVDAQGITLVRQQGHGQAPKWAAFDYAQDFMKLQFTKDSIERILMFPPTDKERDLDYVEKAVSLLTSGGILAAVVRNHDPRRTRIRALAEKGEFSLEPIEGVQDRAILTFKKA